MIQGVQQPLHAPISWPNQQQSCWKIMKAHVYSDIQGQFCAVVNT